MTLGSMPGSPQELLAGASTRSWLRQFVTGRVPRDEVDDLVQTVLCDALAAGRVPAEARELRSWLTGIARHKVADFHRRACRERACDPGEIPAPPAPFEELALADWAERQVAGEDARRTLEWMAREGEGEALEHIAADEDLPAPRVRQRVSRLRRWLRERWVAELAAVAALALIAAATARALCVADESAVPAPRPAGAGAVAAAPLAGEWRLERFTPTGKLDATRQALLDRVRGSLSVRIDGAHLTASAGLLSIERDVHIGRGPGGRLFVSAARKGGGTDAAWCELRGDELVVTADEGPWRGVAVFRRSGR